MRLILIFLLLGVCWCKEDSSNELQPPPNLDERLKKALLKALSELEQEDQSKENSYSEEDHSHESLEYSDREVERVPASSLVLSQQSTTPAPEVSRESEEETERSVVIIQRSKGYQEPTSQTILTNARFPEPLNETDQVLASSNSFLPIKGSGNKYSNAGPNSVSTDYEKNFGSTKRIEITTPLPTTTTEENQAKVEDLQFFSAPLVTAFTVHQDEAGFPKSVIPIYKPTANPAAVAQPTADELYRQHLLQKQKQLALQLQQLQQQQKQQQEYLFRQQQILLQQQQNKQLEEQLRIQKNEQPFRPIVTNQFNNNNNNNNNQFTQSSNNQFVANQPSQFSLKNTAKPSKLVQLPNKQKVSDISFQPSISFTPTTTQHLQLPHQQQQQQFQQQQQTNNQQQQFQQQQTNNYSPLAFLQPPTKNPVDFNTNNYKQQQQQQQQQQSLSIQQVPAISHPTRVITSIQPPVTQNNLGFQALPNPVQSIQFKPTQLFNTAQQPFQTNYFPNKQNAFTSPQNLVQTNNQNTINLQQQQQQQLLNQQFNSFNQQNANKNRFHRHETGTGNFGTNVISHQPHFQQHQSFIEPQQNPTRFFRSNYENYYNVNQYRNPAVNQQLNTLFAQSGLANNKQYEDFNIISKVLSLNHFGNDNVYSSSRYAEQRVPAPYKYS